MTLIITVSSSTSINIVHKIKVVKTVVYQNRLPIFENRLLLSLPLWRHSPRPSYRPRPVLYSDVILTWFFLAMCRYIAAGQHRTMRRLAEVLAYRMTWRQDASMSGDALGCSYCRRHTSVALNTTCIALYCHSAFPYVARPMTRSFFSSPSHYDLVYRKSRLPWTDVVATERRQLYATFCSAWDCLPYVLLSVGLLLETGVRTAIIRPTSKCFSNRRCEFVCVPNYLSCVKTEVGLHSNDVSL